MYWKQKYNVRFFFFNHRFRRRRPGSARRSQRSPSPFHSLHQSGHPAAHTRAVICEASPLLTRIVQTERGFPGYRPVCDSTAARGNRATRPEHLPCHRRLAEGAGPMTHLVYQWYWPPSEWAKRTKESPPSKHRTTEFKMPHKLQLYPQSRTTIKGTISIPTALK